jgi:antitoxin VapB
LFGDIDRDEVMKTVKLFQVGKDQYVRLPDNIRFEGQNVSIKQVGNAVVLTPLNSSWQMLLDSIGEFSDDFMLDRNQPENQYR